MRNFFLGLILATILVSGGYWILSRQNAGEPQQAQPGTAQKYHCPMHPDYVSDRPGDCPICGMKLVPIEKEAGTQGEPAGGAAASASAEGTAGHERKILYYVDSRDSGKHYDQPGKAADGTDLVPIYEEAPAGGGDSVPAGYASVRIPAERLQTMGVITEEARFMRLDQDIHTVGIVTVDETRVRHIHTKFEGFIESIFVNFTGQHVHAGQPLFTIYAPELEATQREYILALKARDQFRNLGSEMRLPGVDLVAASRQRLSLWDITPAQIEQIEKDREPIHALTMFSPVDGYVSAKMAVQGNRVTPSDTIYEVTDLSAIWILADLYESNLAFVKVGDPAIITLPYQPGRVLRGRVSFINPTLDEKSRTAKARIELENPLDLLKPDMYADVVLGGQVGSGLAVPDSAVMGTGEREIVFVAKGNGLFEPREVKTGIKVRGYYQIKSGVTAGERVVTAANFLLDSESKLKAAISK
jgi:RND family efflux transporter MFP subunit